MLLEPKSIVVVSTQQTEVSALLIRTLLSPRSKVFHCSTVEGASTCLADT